MREEVTAEGRIFRRSFAFNCGRLQATALMAALLVSPFIGCGGTSKSTAHLQGAISVGGQPLTADAQGSLTFRPANREQARAVTVPIKNGRYDSPETPVGSVKIYFNIQKPTGRTYNSERAGGPVPELKDIVPAKYASGLDLEVAGAKQDQDFNLE